MHASRFAAIQFVLDGNGTLLRAEDRKMLLHEGAGAQVLSAFVEITLDNSERRMPIDRDETVIRRSIGLKKDEYFIERKRCSKNEARLRRPHPCSGAVVITPPAPPPPRFLPRGADFATAGDRASRNSGNLASESIQHRAAG